LSAANSRVRSSQKLQLHRPAALGRIGVKIAQPEPIGPLGNQSSRRFAGKPLGQKRFAGGNRTGNGRIRLRTIQMIEQPRHAPMNRRMQHRAGRLGRRFQHESPQRHARVRQREHGRVHHQIIVEKQVEVDGARPPSLVALPAQFGFDLLQAGEQIERREGSFERQGAVEKIVLARWPADGRGFPPATSRKHAKRPTIATNERPPHPDFRAGSPNWNRD
jgi:hypothetical protein